MSEIHITSTKGRSRPIGFCADTGAPRSVIGMKEFKRIRNQLGLRSMNIKPSKCGFKFANATYSSLGSIQLPLYTPPGIPTIIVEMEIVPADIPALLGLDVLDEHQLTVDTVFNILAKRSQIVNDDGVASLVDNWSVPLTRSKSRHVYARIGDEVPIDIWFTRSQLIRLHRHFFHPSADKLFNLIKKARPEEATQETRKILENITKRCDPCQRIQNAPHRFRVSFGTPDARFNERIMVDVMTIDGKKVLHVVDEGTRFSAARFLDDESTATVWKTLIECWVAIYTGLPNRIIVDQGSNFGPSFIHMAHLRGINVENTGIESHNSLGIGERYHQPLRQTYRKILVEHSNADPSLALALSVKALNDTLGPEGHVPSALVFGEFPLPYTKSEQKPQRLTVDERAAIASLARKEMSEIMARMRIARGLRHAVPNASNHMYKPGDKILVWRENIVNNQIGEWLGPFEIEGMDERAKIAYIRDDVNSPARPFNIVQIKPYYSPDILAGDFISDVNNFFSYHCSPANEEDIFMTEIISNDDPRAQCEEMNDAKRKEIRDLLRRGTFRAVLIDEVPPDANVIPGRFVLAIKSKLDGKIKFKARFVVGGHRDKLKEFMVHSSQTLQPQSIRILLAIAVLFGFDIWTADVRQAYLQSAIALQRDIYIKTNAPEFELKPEQCLKLLRPLYGLCESGDFWYETFAQHCKDDLKLKQMRSDAALRYLKNKDTLHGLCGSYVDDLLCTGDDTFKNEFSKTKAKFEMADNEDIPCEFGGFALDYNKENILIQHQSHYLNKLNEIEKVDESSYSKFRSTRMKLGWLANTRPDCLFEISQLSQVTEEMFKKNPHDCVKRLNRTIRYARNNEVNINFPKLNLQSLRIIGYSDASFANNNDFTSQLGYIVFIADKHDNAIPLIFKSYKAKRITRSAMSAEVIAFSDMSDTAITLGQEIEILVNQKVPVQLLTDSKSLFDVISKGTRTSEKRTMLDIAASREAFRDKIISDIGFVRSNKNVADGLTKEMNQTALRTVLQSGKLSISPDQWIIRGDVWSQRT